MNRHPGPAGEPRPALLYLAHRLPYPPDKGDRIRSYHLLKSLAERADVHLACFADEPPTRSDLDELRRHCRRVEVVRLGDRARTARALYSLARGRSATEGAFDSPAMRAVVRDWSREVAFRWAVASSSGLVPYLRQKETATIPAIVDLVDVDSQKWLDYAAMGGPKSWLYRLEARRLGRLERSITSWARAVTLVSVAEAATFRRSGGTGPVHPVANGVDLEAFHPGFFRFRFSQGQGHGHDQGDGGPRGCVFVGALDYRPNVDAVDWFCRDAWPAILASRPGSRFAIVGRKPSAAVRRLAGLPGVDLVGQVPDVRPYLAAATVAVVPLRIARGVQNKVLEALAMGKAVVASPEAIEGLEVEPGVHLLTATTPSEWVETVTRLLDDAPLRQRLGTAGRAFVEASHDWGRCLAPFAALLGLDQVVASGCVASGERLAVSSQQSAVSRE